MAAVFISLTLTACTGKDEIIFETDENGPSADAAESSEEGGESAEALDAVETQDDAEGEEAVPSRIYVHICGAVVNAGVYELDEGSRVFEGIEAAGGFADDACEDYVNQAEKLSDGEMLVIPTLTEVEKAKEEGTYQDAWTARSVSQEAADSSSESGLININTATESELAQISGIGAGKAAAIVSYRQENGSFAAVEDIMKVSGIKEGTYEKIKDKITVN